MLNNIINVYIISTVLNVILIFIHIYIGNFKTKLIKLIDLILLIYIVIIPVLNTFGSIVLLYELIEYHIKNKKSGT